MRLVAARRKLRIKLIGSAGALEFSNVHYFARWTREISKTTFVLTRMEGFEWPLNCHESPLGNQTADFTCVLLFIQLSLVIFIHRILTVSYFYMKERISCQLVSITTGSSRTFCETRNRDITGFIYNNRHFGSSVFLNTFQKLIVGPACPVLWNYSRHWKIKEVENSKLLPVYSFLRAYTPTLLNVKSP